MIDGTIAADSVAVIALGGDRTAWSLLAASALVWIAGNGINARLVNRARSMTSRCGEGRMCGSQSQLPECGKCTERNIRTGKSDKNFEPDKTRHMEPQ